jgi:hypothetical protein
VSTPFGGSGKSGPDGGEPEKGSNGEPPGGGFGRGPHVSPNPAADGGPYPDPRSAFLLTVATFLLTGLVGVFFLGLGAVVAIGIGQAIAVGAIGTMAARRVPEPQAERIGLRSFDPRALPLLLCLVPAILLASELDNIATDWSVGGEGASTESSIEPDRDAGDGVVDGDSDAAAPDPARENGAAEETLNPAEEAALEALQVDLDDPWTLAQAFVISVGITPIVEEFFFRGVVQQSLVARLGLVRGVGFVAVLYTLPHLPAVATFPRFLAGILSAFGMGCLLGLVRIATGSILASILLASLTAAVGIVAFAVREDLPLPGMNVEGTHLPVTVTLASLLVVAWATRALCQEAKKSFEADRSRRAPPQA